MPASALSGAAEATLVEGVGRDPVLGKASAKGLEGMAVVVETMQPEHDNARLFGVSPAPKGQGIAIAHPRLERQQARFDACVWFRHRGASHRREVFGGASAEQKTEQ